MVKREVCWIGEVGVDNVERAAPMVVGGCEKIVRFFESKTLVSRAEGERFKMPKGRSRVPDKTVGLIQCRRPCIVVAVSQPNLSIC
jgi:hypothetical protein